MFWENIRNYMKENCETYESFAEKIGTGKTTFYTWYKRETIPSADYALKIADIMEVDLRTLLYGKDNSTEKEQLKKRLDRRVEKMSEYELKLIINLASGIIKLDNEEAGN